MSDDDYLFAGLKVLHVGTSIAGPVAGTILATTERVPELGF